jgi:uncharacterized repeat protein (TIGR03803 family)
MNGSSCRSLLGSALCAAWLMSACDGGVNASRGTYSIGGKVSGLESGASLVLQNNRGDLITVKANGSFAFAKPVPYLGSYAVAVATQPPAQVCSVSGGTGGVVTANISSVSIACGAASESVIYSFAVYSEPADSQSALIQGTDGNFYGTSYFGGTSGNGTVFKITPAGAETVLYSFAGGTDGSNPSALIQASDGNFYGTTGAGGTSNAGTFFKITPEGVETVLYSFKGGASDGAGPSALIQASDGNFYGTTGAGGPFGFGTVFKITPARVETVLYLFGSGDYDGAYPTGLIQASDGNFYGTTSGGGSLINRYVNIGGGTVFKITPAGVETVLYAFKGGTDGAHPEAALFPGRDGYFYGTTTGYFVNNQIVADTPTDLSTVFKF